MSPILDATDGVNFGRFSAAPGPLRIFHLLVSIFLALLVISESESTFLPLLKVFILRFNFSSSVAIPTLNLSSRPF